jgi:hypothetical protein
MRGDYYSSSRPATEADITLESLANMLDEDAENINAHDFVTCHRGLAALLHKRVGRKAATDIFRHLVDMRGLHGMLGICGRTDPADAEQLLGVPLNNWKEWHLDP